MLIYKSIYTYEQLTLTSLHTDEEMNCNYCTCKVRYYPRNPAINGLIFDVKEFTPR